MSNLVTERSRGLSRQETALVEAIATAAENGITLTREEMGTLAGYGKGEIARVSATRALGRPDVRRALMERAQQVVAADALHAVHLLRSMRQAQGRDRLPATIETLKLTGMGQAEASGGGGGITLQLVIGDAAALVLGQTRVIGPQVLEHEPVTQPDYTRSQDARRSRKAATPPPPKRKAKAKAKAGVQKPRAKPPARVIHTISPPPDISNEDGTE